MSPEINETFESATPVEIVPLHNVVAQIIEDSNDDPQSFLDEVVVPNGGE